jgi:hypothetical protein
MNRSVTMKVLQRYCLENEIPVPASATREELEAFITRAILHERTLKPDQAHGCFGLWGDDDTNCLTCVYAEECAKVSLGMAAKRYRAFVKRLENPKFSTQVKARVQRTRKNHRSPGKDPGERGC